MPGLLEGKQALVLGIANKWSLAYAIAQAFSREGARLVLTYLGEHQKEAIESLAEGLTVDRILPCDVTKDEDLAGLSAGFEGKSLDAVVHSLAFANREDLARPFVETSRSGFLLAQDVIYVGGGNTANMVAIWRLHGVDVILREAWERGVVLAGLSAGGLCWFEQGSTDSFGPGLAALDGLLGFLPGAFCPHYDGEAMRRPRLHELIASGSLGPTYACDDGAAVVFHGTKLHEAIAEREGATAYRVERLGGTVRETALPTRLLP